MDLTKRPLLAIGIILLLLFGLAGLAGAEPGGEQNAKEESKLKSSFSDVASGNKNLLFINYLAERG